MILSDKEIIDILQREELTDIDQLNVIQTYILHHKKINVGQIERPTNNIQLVLMTHAYNKCVIFYTKTLLC